MAIGMIERGLNLERDLAVGKIAGSGLLTTGRIFYVKEPSDVDIAEFRENIPATERFSTIQLALAACRAGTNDYVLLCPVDDGGAWAQTENIDLDKNYVHLVGVGTGPGLPRITFSTAKSVRIGPSNTVNNVIRGIEISNLEISASGTSNISCVDIGTSDNGYTLDTYFNNCRIFTSATTAAIAEIRSYGMRNRFQSCIIGTHKVAHADDNYIQIAPTAPITGAMDRDDVFLDCEFRHFAAAVGDQFCTMVSLVAQMAKFRRCLFINNSTTQIMTAGIVSSGVVVLDHCGFVGASIAVDTTAKGWIIPLGQGNSVLAADVYNPMLAGDGIEPVGVDT